MFHWICPECGEECSPAIRDCPTCYPSGGRSREAETAHDVEPQLSLVAAATAVAELPPQELPVGLREGAEQLALLPQAENGLAQPLLNLADQLHVADEVEAVSAVEPEPTPAAEGPAIAEAITTEADAALSETTAVEPEPTLAAEAPAVEPEATVTTEADATEPAPAAASIAVLPETAAVEPEPMSAAEAPAIEPEAAVATEADAVLSETTAVEPEPTPAAEAPAAEPEAAVATAAVEPEPTPAVEPEAAVATEADATEPVPAAESIAALSETTAFEPEPTPAAEPEAAVATAAVEPAPAAEPITALSETTAVEPEPTPAVEPEAAVTTAAVEPAPAAELIAVLSEPEPTPAAEPEAAVVTEADATAAEPIAVTPDEPEAAVAAAEPEPEPAIAAAELTAAAIEPELPFAGPEPSVRPHDTLAELAALAATSTAMSEPFIEHRDYTTEPEPLPLPPPIDIVATPAPKVLAGPAQDAPNALVTTGPVEVMRTAPAAADADEVVDVVAEEAPQQKNVPGWLVSLVAALVFLVVGITMLFYVLPAGAAKTPRSADAASAPATPAVVNAASVQHPLTRYLEITGLRVNMNLNRKSTLQYIVVNHSAAEIAEASVNVVVRSAAAAPQQPPVCAFKVKIPSLGPFESREYSMPIDTQVRSLEMPEWQNLRADVDVTVP